MINAPPPIARYPLTQPPSHKSPDLRNAQLIRLYTSLLRSTPLILFFQHNNLTRAEWIYVRRELFNALQKTDAQESTDLAHDIKIQVLQVRMFKSALAIVEHFHPEANPPSSKPPHATDPSTQSSFDKLPKTATPNPQNPIFTHDLSTAARNAAYQHKDSISLSPLLCGPLAALILPQLNPAHLKTALSILAPEKPLYPPPTRKSTPTWHDPITQSGLQKLMLLGARVEGKAFDATEPRRIGAIEGGVDGLRAQVVALLNSVAGGVANTLEQSRMGIWMTMEGRKAMMQEEEAKGQGQGDKAPESAGGTGGDK